MNKPSGKLAFAYATIANLEEKIARIESAQPTPIAVVLPERKHHVHQGLSHTDAKADGWNACLKEVTLLNSTRPAHANPPPGTEPSGTHHDNDGLDEWRKP